MNRTKNVLNAKLVGKYSKTVSKLLLETQLNL